MASTTVIKKPSEEGKDQVVGELLEQRIFNKLNSASL